MNDSPIRTGSLDMSELNDNEVEIAKDAAPDVRSDVIATKPVVEGERELSSTSNEIVLSADAAAVDAKILLQSGKEYMAPALLHNVDVDDFLSLGGAPWFDIEALEVEGFIDRNAIDRWLPGEVSLEWTRSWAWRPQCACHDDVLVPRRWTTLKDVRKPFCDKMCPGLESLNTEVLCPVEESIFVHPKRGGIEYIECLREIPEEHLEAWRSATCLDPSAWIWRHAQLRVNLLERFCSNERRMRSQHGRAIRY